MRFPILAAVALVVTATPAMAQRDPVEQRVNRLEQELRAVQRRVFQNGPVIQPEITPQPQTDQGGLPAGNAITSITARVDALERQLATLTGQAEENGHRLRQLEAAFETLRTGTEARLREAEQRSRPAEPEPTPARPRSEDPAATNDEARQAPAGADAPASDPAEAAYNAGYRLWNDRRYTEAQTALEAVAQRYPRSRWASWARNLAGRAYLDDDKPASAARILLENYQTDPRGERAADSLYFLGQALVRLDRRTEACRVYDELQEVYGSNMRAFIRQRLPEARTAARCGN